MSADELYRGDRVEYVGEPLGPVNTGTTGFVMKVQSGSALVAWPHAGPRQVPAADLRLLGPEVTRVVGEAPNRGMWGLLGEELPPKSNGRPRDPYMEQGCHPDIVARVWSELGKSLPRDCRAQAKGKPVLAHPGSDRIIALAHGTAYALWLTDAHLGAAREAGAQTVMVWSGGRATDLAERAGPGWIWGRWYEHELRWVRDAFDAAGS